MLVCVVLVACNLWFMLFMLPIAWCYVAARLIYAEPLVGDRLFWITRPYEWKSLLAAKAMFILAFVNLPMIVADVIILLRNGFPIFENLAGVLWHQFLIATVFVLPVVVFATITKGLAQLAWTTFLLLLVPFFLFHRSNTTGVDWQGLDWIRYSFLIVILVLAGGFVVLRQYKVRRTAMARMLALGALLLIVLEATYFPWGAAFWFQSWFSKQRIDADAVHVAIDPGRTMPPFNVWPGPKSLWFQLPLRITGLGAGVDTRADAALVTVGSQAEVVNGSFFSDGEDRFRLAFQLNRSAFERMKNEPVSVRASLYLTLLGNPKSTTVPRGKLRTRVSGVGRCTILTEPPLFAPMLHCLSALRDSSDAVSLRPASGNFFVIARPTSYSPYPAELGVSPVYPFIHEITARSDPLVMVSEEALTHFRKDAEFRDISLANFVVTSPRTH
ncbi:MAG TPA: hypothetical protein VEU96_24945 [Bryobacteraceae bacterium]|nr:hypothetical protein [Bryobacteraceae bacterium]